MESLFNTAGTTFRGRIDSLRSVLIDADPSLEELSGEFLEFTQSLLFEQGGVFKYGFTLTGRGLAFHCALLVPHPDVAALAADLFPDASLEQDILFFPDDGFPQADRFRELIEAAAVKPFPPQSG